MLVVAWLVWLVFPMTGNKNKIHKLDERLIDAQTQRVEQELNTNVETLVPDVLTVGVGRTTHWKPKEASTHGRLTE